MSLIGAAVLRARRPQPPPPEKTGTLPHGFKPRPKPDNDAWTRRPPPGWYAEHTKKHRDAAAARDGARALSKRARRAARNLETLPLAGGL